MKFTTLTPLNFFAWDEVVSAFLQARYVYLDQYGCTFSLMRDDFGYL